VRSRVAALLALSAVASCSYVSVSTPPRTIASWEWPTYGHDAQHTFTGETTLTTASVTRLRPSWRFATGDAVTATPTIVRGTVYAGSWDGYFYAIDLRSGSLRWKYQLQAQHAVTPYPGQNPRDFTSDGGLVTASAWYQLGDGNRPDLVIFAGGYTLYALDASNGALFWRHEYTGRPEQPPDPDHDGTRIFSSPVVAGDKVLFGVDVDGQRGERGYIAAASLATGDPVWQTQTDVDGNGRVLNDGCGSVWSSGTVLPSLGLVVFDVADCNFSNPPPFSESVMALRISDGTPAWVFRPAREDVTCDTDFGATANAGINAAGDASFLGVGSKDGTYYAIDPATGRQRWSSNVVFGGFSGGFIATAAYDGQHVFGSTGLGDFGRFEHGDQVFCKPSDPRDLPSQEPTAHAFDASTGKVLWQKEHVASFAPTTVAGGMVFNGLAIAANAITVRDATSGTLLAQVPLPTACWSGIATVGDALVLGTGSSNQGSPDFIIALTPDGAPPVLPSRG
jgi:outer membrane protein assembly factor BamB